MCILSDYVSASVVMVGVAALGCECVEYVQC